MGRDAFRIAEDPAEDSAVLTVIVNTDAAAREAGRSLRVRCGLLVARMLHRLVPASVEATD